MTEYFCINDLDLQSRFHYAPQDSSMHVAEKVMRSLNECLGDGRAIPVNYEKSIFEHMETEGLSELSNDEIERMQQEKEILAAKECAENVEKRFDGKSCMGTSIHARQPWYSNERKFFFDEQFLLKCAHASSATVLEQCAGKGYFNFLSKFFEEHYVLYNNGFEGIRNGCATADKQCSFHKNVANQGVLKDGWRGTQIQRIEPPVPDYSRKDGFHYTTPEPVVCGKPEEMHSSKDDKFITDAASREVDDYNPKVKLEELLLSCGMPILEVEVQNSSDGSASAKVVDKNDTLGKALAKVDEFVTTYTGKDLECVVINEIHRRHGIRIKSEVSKKLNASAKAAEKAKTFDEINWGKHISENTLQKLYVCQLDIYLRKIGYTNHHLTKKGFTKDKKIDAVKKHFYTDTNDSVSHVTDTNTMHVSLPPLLAKKPVTTEATKTAKNALIQVPPWGGEVYLPIIGMRTMVNTCPIDNFLTIMYSLWKTSPLFYEELTRSSLLYASTLIKVFNLFNEKKFGDGKYLWLQQFSGRFDFTNNATIDVWGNEEDLFVSRVGDTLCSTVQSKCSSAHCPNSMVDVHSTRITLRYKS